jgi:hypothetical protein
MIRRFVERTGNIRRKFSFFAGMKLPALLKRLRKIFFGRIARNIWFWLFILYTAHGYNVGNDAHDHYGLVASRPYIPVMAAMLLLQCTLMYVNNLILVPKLLARRRALLFVPAALGLCLAIGFLTSVTMKLAAPFMQVGHLHHASLTQTIVSKTWGLESLFGETKSFAFSDVFWLVAFTLAWYANDYMRQQRALRESEAQRIRTELAFLRNQLNPHFLFNTLNNIYGLVYLKSDAAPELVLKLSSLLRYLLYETDVETIAFAKERAAIEAYAEIESLRLPDSAQLRIDIAADAEYDIPPLLWLPILENNFKHGSRLIHESVSLDFSFRIERDRLQIRSSNRYEQGQEQPAGAHGLGLDNLRKRLRILYPGNHQIGQQRKDGVFSILIEINLKAHATSRPDRR